jgi:E3 ubiquitin-protein ligase MARCH6
MELYLILPFHTAVQAVARGGGEVPQGVDAVDARQTVRIIQSWTLGVIYLKLATRVVTERHQDTRLAMAMQAVLRRGMLEPDVGVLTRVFVVPGVVLGCVAVFGPVAAMRALLTRGYLDSYADGPASVVTLHRMAYPAATLVVFVLWLCWRALAVFNRWTVRIKDEAYLIGERLHNFGVTSTSPALARATDWRAGRNRL